MPIGTAAAVGLGSAALGAIGSGKGKKGEAPAQQGFAALPQKVKDAWLETYMPAVLAQYGQQRANIPMQRASNPAQDPFASKAMYEMQNYSDRIPGGYFGNGQKPQQQAQPPQQGGMTPQMMQEIQGMMQAQSGGMPRGKGDWINQSPLNRLDPDTGQKLQQYYGLTPDQQGVLTAPGGGSKIFQQMFGFNPYGSR